MHSLCEMIIPPRRPEHGSDYVSRSVYQVMTRFARECEEHPAGGNWYALCHSGHCHGVGNNGKVGVICLLRMC